jgi:hypothetical protein
MERLSDKLIAYLRLAEGKNVNLKDIRSALNIETGSKDDNNLRTQMSTTLIEKKIVSSLGRNDGIYKVIKPVQPINWWEDRENEEPLNFRFPRCYEDNTEFGIEDLVEIYAGDMILIAGTSNYGKTTIALSLLGENLGLMAAYLMGSEYTAANGKISPKFKRRMKRMNWVEWMAGGKPRFQLYPVGADYEDYIQPDALNVVDWITLPGEYYLIDSVMKSMKDRVGNGVIVAVLQKNRNMEWGEGGERSERYADVYITIDSFSNESILTLGKVKAPKKSKATGRMWAFSIVDYGANLHNIREVIKCPKCWGKGYTGSANNYKKCDTCEGRKFVDR